MVGKPIGIAGTSWLVTKLSRGRLRPPVGWAAVTGGGTIAGIGFTVSLLIASLAFPGAELEEAKLGVLTAALCASVLTWLVFRVTGAAPERRPARALLGTSEVIVDLAVAGRPASATTSAGPRTRRSRSSSTATSNARTAARPSPSSVSCSPDFGDVRYVWRHLPLNDVHPHAQLAAEASEAAAAQGTFWEMHDLLLDHQDALRPTDLWYAEQLGLDGERFDGDLRGTPARRGSPRTSTRPT